MNDRHATNIERLFEAVQSTPGETDPQFRRSIAEHVEGMSIHSSETVEKNPPELVSYVHKVALNAYKVTDEDIEALRRAGYAEDAIFEITLSVAMSAGRIRLEHGLVALKGKQK